MSFSVDGLYNVRWSDLTFPTFAGGDLDEGKAVEAATQFFENYQNDKQGARAGDSLLFLSDAMVAIGDTNRACIALAEFSEAYPALATGRLKEQYDRNRSKVTCN